LTLSLIIFATDALAIGELPVVNPERTISALDLYGVPPAARQNAVAKSSAHAVHAAPAVRAGDAELLIPNKPAGDLWSNNGGNIAAQPPLRMPDPSEYRRFAASDYLPEETLDAQPRQNIVRVMPAKPEKTRKIIAVREPDPVVVAETEPVVVARAEPAVKSQIIPSAIKSAPKFAKVPEPKIAEAAEKTEEFAYKEEIPLTKLSPAELKRAFKKTFTTENKHLATYQIDSRFDEVSVSESKVGFDSGRDLSEQGGVRPLEIKIGFSGDDSSLSRDNYNLLTEYAGIVANNPKRAVQVSIPERATRSYDGRKLAARRLAIIEQVLKDSGIIDKRIVPVLSQRSEDSFVLRVISNDTFQTLSEKKRDIFGDTTSGKTYRSMSW
jgi:hypothetical protein